MPLTATAVRFDNAPTSHVAGRLDAARRTVEGRFLQAGEVLGQAVEGLGRLIASLDKLGAALDAETVGAMTAELESAGGDLKALPVRHDGRRRLIETLSGAGERLDGGVQDMRRTLAYLRVFAINIKITAGGIAAAGPAFADFAQEICDRIELGRGQLDAFDTEVQTLRDLFREAQVHERELAQQCDRLLPAVPDGLSASARAMVAQHQRVAQAAQQVASLARAVQKKMGSALAALQIGDITRQRIEHVSQALDLLDAQGGLSSDQRTRMEAFVHGLLAEQLRATARDFHRDVARIGQAMAGIADDASEILRLRDLAFGRGESGGDSFLRSLESHVGQALALVDDMALADSRARKVGSAAGEATARLTERIEGLRSIKADVQQMALNTTLKCSRLGDAGKPLAVIAIELRAHAGAMDTASQEALGAREGLADAGAMGEAEDLSAAVGSALADVGGRLKQASDSAEADLAGLARQGEIVVESLRRASGRLHFQREIGIVLDEAADALAACAGEGAPGVSDLEVPLGGLLARMAAAYTMAQEREVHAALTAHLAFEAPAGEAPPPAAADDDVLF